MSTPIESGSLVRWAEGEGRVLHLTGTTDVTKAAGSELADAVARIRVYQDGQPTPEVRMVLASALEAAPTDPEPVAKAAGPADLDAMVANLSEQDRYIAAASWLTLTGPRLPTTIIGADGPQHIVGIDQAGGARGI